MAPLPPGAPAEPASCLGKVHVGEWTAKTKQSQQRHVWDCILSGPSPVGMGQKVVSPGGQPGEREFPLSPELPPSSLTYPAKNTLQ